MTSTDNVRPLEPNGPLDTDYGHWCAPLQDYLNQNIPLTRTMALEVSRCNHGELVLNAPLEPNINDKGTAFGGSIASLLTLAGWGVVWILSQHDQLKLDTVVRQLQLRYLRPATGPLVVRCAFPTAAEWQHFKTRLNQNGRARITLEPALESDGNLASAMIAEYAGRANSA